MRLPEVPYDPINSLSRSALARVLFLHERDSIQKNGTALASKSATRWATPSFLSFLLNDELCQSPPPTRLGENKGLSPYPLEFISLILPRQNKDKAGGTGL